MFGEPPHTQGDLHFKLFGFPVRIHPWFWLIAALLGLGSGGKLLYVFIWIAAMFLGILIHELGHAFAMRAFGLRPWITLYGFGGLTSYNTADLMRTSASDWKKQIFISFAGPGAGFLLAGLLLFLVWITGHPVTFYFGTESPYLFWFMFEPFAFIEIGLFIKFMVFISLIWGMFNLLPIYPLDGGQIVREIFLRVDRPSGLRRSLTLSMWAAGLCAGYFLFLGAQAFQDPSGGGSSASLFVAILFGYMSYTSWSMFQMVSGGRRRW